jgi:hypothetical protein
MTKNILRFCFIIVVFGLFCTGCDGNKATAINESIPATKSLPLWEKTPLLKSQSGIIVLQRPPNGGGTLIIGDAQEQDSAFSVDVFSDSQLSAKLTHVEPGTYDFTDIPLPAAPTETETYYLKILQKTKLIKPMFIAKPGFYYQDGDIDIKIPLNASTGIKDIPPLIVIPVTSPRGTCDGSLINWHTFPRFPNINSKVFLAYRAPGVYGLGRVEDATVACYDNVGNILVYWDWFFDLKGLKFPKSYTTDKNVLMGCAISHEMGHALGKDPIKSPATAAELDNIMQDTMTLIDQVSWFSRNHTFRYRE